MVSTFRPPVQRPPTIGAARRMLLVAHGYPPNQANGAEAQLRRKARWWAARGHEVCVVAADPQSAECMPFGRVERLHEDVDGIPVTRLRFAVPDATRPLRETFRHPMLAAALEREVTTFAPDIVYQLSGYIFGVVPLDIARDRGLPAVLFATDYWHTCQRVTQLRPDRECCPGPRRPADCAACRVAARMPAAISGGALHRASWQTLAHVGHVLPGATAVRDFEERRAAIADALSHVSLVVVNSTFLARSFGALGVPDERLLVIRQGIEAGEFDARRCQRSDGELRALYLGQLSRHKGVDLLIDATRSARADGRPISARVVGPMTDTNDFERWLAAAVGDGITVEPPQPRERLAAMLGASDVLVVPSRWYENSPNVILEAFAAGVPVIAADHGGMAEMVRHDVDGLLFAPGAADALAAALRRLVDEPGLLERLRGGITRPHGTAHEMRAEDAALEHVLGVAAR